MFRYMSLDLNSILKDWPHESGSIKVRKIAGLDGREKLQLRVDLGLLQMELTGRPDGRRPHNCESLLEYHQKRAARIEQKGEAYELTPEQCAEQLDAFRAAGCNYFLMSAIGEPRDERAQLETIAAEILPRFRSR